VLSMDDPAPTARGRSLPTALILIIAYTTLALIITHPLVMHLTTRVPHDLGDPLLSTIILWWNAHHLPLTRAWWNGPFFWPATGTLTLSDHRLGESLLATPLQWIGLSPLTAYNLTLLATFPACATAAHWMAFRLTRRHDASMIAGLAFGFNPYRFAHIEHLELLAAFGMPIALGALHEYLADGRRRWLVLFAAALLLQALLCSYYFLFFLVLLGLWVLWFLRPRDVRVLAGIAIACALVVAAMSPVAFEYLRVHREQGLARGLGDIVTLSADVTSIATASPLSLLWGWTSAWNGGERQLFPGVTIVMLVAIAVVASLRSAPREGGSRASLALLAIATVIACVAASALWLGPWRLGPLSVGTWYKPFSIAVYLSIGALLASPTIKAAYRRRSLLAFYVLAALALFIFSWGPKPAFFHQQFLYEPPYAWLMQLSIFRDGIRVPARFAMPTILALSAAAALAYARLVTTQSARVAAVLVTAGILADSWIAPIPLFERPARWPDEMARTRAAVAIELPLGDTMRDIAAMYRAMAAGIPIVNGNSGYLPAHYRPLTLALATGDETAFDALTEAGPLLVSIDRTDPGAENRVEWLRRNPRASLSGSTSAFTWFVVRGSEKRAPRCDGNTVRLVAARDWWGPLPIAPLTDRSNDTWWLSGDTQQTGDFLLLDLGQAARPCSVRLGLGTRPAWYPNALSVATSVDGTEWRTEFSGKLGGEAIRAAIAQPRDAVIELPAGGAPARYIRLRIESDQPNAPWIVTEVTVTASRPG